MRSNVLFFALGSLAVVVGHDLFILVRRLLDARLSYSRGSLYSHG